MSRYEVITRHRPGAALSLDPTARIGRRVSIDTTGDVTIGARTIVSEDALILTHDHFDGLAKRLTVTAKTIGADVFIGARAIILPSCSSIGDGAVVGAGAVVTHDVPAGERWAGNPARKIG